MIEISAIEFADIMTDPSNSSNHTTLRNKLIAQAKTGKAKLISNQSILARSGERAMSESIREFTYETEYEPAEGIPNKEEDPSSSSYKPMLAIFPPNPTAFETRNLGTTIQVEPILGQDMEIIDLNIKPEIVKQVGYHVFSEWVTESTKSKVQLPIFYSIRLNTSLTLKNAQFTLAGTYSPEIDGKSDDSKKILFFVKANVLKVSK